MSELTGQIGEVRMVVQITRANTGAVEEYELTGKCTEEEFNELTKSDPAEE